MNPGSAAHEAVGAPTPPGGRPLVSIVIPAWQAAETIPEALQSVLEQTLSDWEAIVVSDGSTDDTVSLAKARARADRRISVVEQAHGGVSRARNLGVSLARAEWLLFLDADDWLAPAHLERTMEAATSEVGAVLCGWVRVAPDGARTEPAIPPQPDDALALLSQRCPVAVHACVVRRELVRRVGGFDLGLTGCEDWDLWLRIAATGARFVTVPEVLAYYRMRPGSACADGRRFLSDGLEVLRRAHRTTDGATSTTAENPTTRELASRRFHFMTWVAGHYLGSGGDASSFPAEVDCPDEVSAASIAANLFDSIPLGAASTHDGWPSLWQVVDDRLRRFLAGLSARSSAPELADSVRTTLMRQVMNAVDARPLTIGPLHAIRLELTGPLHDIVVDPAVERLQAQLLLEGSPLGTVELPVVGGAVPAAVLADTAASRHAWEILRRHLEQTQSPDAPYSADLHNQTGWANLLRSLWRPLPAPHGVAKEARGARSVGDGWLTLEVAGDATIDGLSWPPGPLSLLLTVGGAPVAAVTVEVGPEGLPPARLQGVIQQACGFELCIAAVREGLLGSPLRGSMRERLLERWERRRNPPEVAAQAGASQIKVAPGTEWILDELLGDGRPTLVLAHRPGPTAFFRTSASRRAVLPPAAADALAWLARRNGELASLWPADCVEPARVVYVPDLLPAATTEVDRQQPEAPATSKAEDRRHGFETIFAAGPEPWNYSSDYEQAKYAETMELLPGGRIASALELGCAEGHFTERLAPRVERLVGADISEIALRRARERCRPFPHVEFLALDLAADALPGGFDVVVCSEVLYYTADRDGLMGVVRKLVSAVNPGGHLLTAHSHVLVDAPDRPGFDWDDAPFGASFIAETLSAVPGVDLVRELRTPMYRIQLFRKRRDGEDPAATPRASRVEERPVGSALDPDVAAHFRPSGDARATVTSRPRVVTERLPVLMYHRVASHGPSALARYRVSPSAFEEQLGYLHAVGYRGVTVDQWAAAWGTRQPLPGRSVLLTFDDAYVDFLSQAWPALRRYGFPATLFVPAGHVGGASDWDAAYGDPVALLDWRELRGLAADGLHVGSHGWSHRPLDLCSPAEIAEEGARSRQVLEEQLQTPVTSIAYPYGRWDPVVSHVLAGCGYRQGFTTDPVRSHFHQPIMELSRIEVAGGDDLGAFVAKLSDVPLPARAPRRRDA